MDRAAELVLLEDALQLAQLALHRGRNGLAGHPGQEPSDGLLRGRRCEAGRDERGDRGSNRGEFVAEVDDLSGPQPCGECLVDRGGGHVYALPARLVSHPVRRLLRRATERGPDSVGRFRRVEGEGCEGCGVIVVDGLLDLGAELVDPVVVDRGEVGQ